MAINLPDEIRTPQAVARRALALFGVVGVAFGGDREVIIGWLRDNNLFDELSPVEARFLVNPAPSKRQVVIAGWYSERLIVLAWALGLLAMPSPAEQCDTALFQKMMPPYAEVEVDEFISSAQLRTSKELIAAADTILNEHWVARDAAIHNREPSAPVDLEVIQERHHAINWIIGHEGLPWDEATTDT